MSASASLSCCALVRVLFFTSSVRSITTSPSDLISSDSSLKAPAGSPFSKLGSTSDHRPLPTSSTRCRLATVSSLAPVVTTMKPPSSDWPASGAGALASVVMLPSPCGGGVVRLAICSSVARRRKWFCQPWPAVGVVSQARPSTTWLPGEACCHMAFTLAAVSSGWVLSLR